MTPIPNAAKDDLYDFSEARCELDHEHDSSCFRTRTSDGTPVPKLTAAYLECDDEIAEISPKTYERLQKIAVRLDCTMNAALEVVLREFDAKPA